MSPDTTQTKQAVIPAGRNECGRLPTVSSGHVATNDLLGVDRMGTPSAVAVCHLCPADTYQRTAAAYARRAR